MYFPVQNICNWYKTKLAGCCHENRNKKFNNKLVIIIFTLFYNTYFII